MYFRYMISILGVINHSNHIWNENNC